MKKFLSIVMFIVIALETSILAQAAENGIITENSQNKSGNITVDYNAGVTYKITIPASVTFTDTEKDIERGLLVENVLLNEGSTLNVAVESLNNYKLKNGEGYIDYYLMINRYTILEENNSNILIVEAGEASGWVMLYFITDLNKEHALYAGNYTDTLTFTVTID